jgi:ketopantoate reductase
MNGLGIEEALAASLGSSLPIFGGMAFTCINRGEPGVVNHLKYGPIQVTNAQRQIAHRIAAPPAPHPARRRAAFLSLWRCD